MPNSLMASLAALTGIPHRIVAGIQEQLLLILIALCEEFIKGLGLLNILTVKLLPGRLLNAQPVLSIGHSRGRTD